MVWGPGERAPGSTKNVTVRSSPSRSIENGADSGSERQPVGSLSRSVPCAGPFTLLCTVQEKAKDFVPSGTAPAAGETVTEIAGATIRGSGTTPSALIR